MATERPKDPGDVFRELVTEWERGFDKLANTLMGTETFSRSMNQMQDVQMAVRNAFREFMTQNLTTANMPTRDDILPRGRRRLKRAQRAAHSVVFRSTRSRSED
jgi:hypothetical protein